MPPPFNWSFSSCRCRPVVAVMLLSLLATTAGWWMVADQAYSRDRERFEAQSLDLWVRLSQRMQSYELAVRNARALFAASEHVERHEWSIFFESMDLEANFPGMYGIAFTQRVPRAELDAFVAEARADGCSDFHVWHHSDQPADQEYAYVVKYHQPEDRNRGSLGFDISTLPGPRAAKHLARDTGDLAVVLLNRLVQDPDGDFAAVMYIPIYRNGMPTNTIEARRRSLYGWAAAPIRLRDFIQAAKYDARTGLGIRIYSGDEPSPESLLYDADPEQANGNTPRRRARRHLSQDIPYVLGGQHLIIRISTTPAFDAESERAMPILVVVMGFVVSILLTGITWSLTTTSARAKSLADQMTVSLRESEAQLRTLVENIPGAIYRCHSDPQWTMVFISDPITAITGRPPSAFINNRDVAFVDVIHPDDRAAVTQSINEAIERDRPFSVEYRMLDVDGRVHWVHEQGRADRGVDGEVEWIDGVIFDITARRLDEMDRERLQKELVFASRRAGMAQMATSVLHNVGNVLNSVNVAATVVRSRIEASRLVNLRRVSQLLNDNQDNLEKFLTEDPRGKALPGYLTNLAEVHQQDHDALLAELDGMTRSIDHIKSTVASQQMYAKQMATREQFTLRELADEALRIVSTSLRRHSVRVERNYDAVSPVNADRHMILQILVNLLTNAVKATTTAGRSDARVTIRITRIDVAGSARQQLVVEDNGIGMTPDVLDRLFQLGFTTHNDGHGFGLHSAANAAKEMGGRLIAASDGPGQGSRFTLEIPETPGSASSPGSPDPSPAARQ